MKPTGKMRIPIDVDPARSLAARLIRGSESSADLSALAARKAEAERALQETRDEMAEGRVNQTVRDHVKALVKALIGEPPPGPPGTVLVRVVGVPSEKGAPKVPLSGLSVSLTPSGQEPVEAETDGLGQALLRLPEEGAGRSPVVVLSPAGETLASKRCPVRAKRKKTGDEEEEETGVTMVFEVPYRKDLDPVFQHAEVWARAQQAAFSRAEVFQKAVGEALLKQESELSELIKRLDNALRYTPPQQGDDNGSHD